MQGAGLTMQEVGGKHVKYVVDGGGTGQVWL